MKYSKLHVKTNKTAKEQDSVNATLLQKAGFVDQTMAGAYTYLPLGFRVLQKIEKIVREEMDKISAEIFMPAIVPVELWEKTNRRDSVDVLFEVRGANDAARKKNDATYILNSTHEEVVTPLAQKFVHSYKDLPASYYQIQSKFRNEARPKSGIMRGREFRMKDMYSFHTSEADLLDYYHSHAKAAYLAVYDRLGLGEDTVVALASGGDFTKEFSHEFQTKCESGEDTIFHDTVNDIYYNREVTPSKAVDLQDKNEEMRTKEDIYGENIVGMDDLVKFLKIPAHKSIKTLIYEVDGERVVVVAVRGDYDVDEGKLIKVIGCKSLKLASEEQVRDLTGAEIGYAGVINLPEGTEIYFDDATEPLINFECGTNKTNYHTINVNWDRDVKRPEKYHDFKVAKEGDLNPATGEVYSVFRAAEVGNIFPLNTKFTDAWDFKFVDSDGKAKPVYMGCYGIGTTRIMGVIVEKYNDEKGIIWPKQIAPFQIHLIHLGREEEMLKRAENLYFELIQQGYEVLWDDRDENPGAKFADADLIGIPVRVVVSKRSIESGGYEVKLRAEDNSEIVGEGKLEKWLESNV